MIILDDAMIKEEASSSDRRLNDRNISLPYLRDDEDDYNEWAIIHTTDFFQGKAKESSLRLTMACNRNEACFFEYTHKNSHTKVFTGRINITRSG